MNYDSTIICNKIKTRIINIIQNIQFSPIIIDNVSKYINDNNINKNTLGVSVRTWKGAHENNINREYNFQVYNDKILDVLCENKFIDKIIFSFDNYNVENDYINLCEKNKNVSIILICNIS